MLQLPEPTHLEPVLCNKRSHGNEKPAHRNEEYSPCSPQLEKAHTQQQRPNIAKKKKKSTNNKCWKECGEEGTLLHCWWECKLVQPLWRTVWRFLKKLKIELTMWPSNPTPGHISGENSNSNAYMYPNVHSSTIYNSQDMEATWMSIDRGIDKEDVVYIHNGILLSHKKEGNNTICSNKDGPRDYHTKWSKSYREREISYDISYMWNLRK